MRIKRRPDNAPAVEEAPKERDWEEIVGGWLKEESFYREITTRTLSAALVAIAAYLGAVGLGYVGRPPANALVMMAVVVIALSGIVLISSLMHKGRRRIGSVLLVVLMVFILGSGYASSKMFPNANMGKWGWVVGLVEFTGFVIVARLLNRRRAKRDLARETAAQDASSKRD